MEDIKLIDKLRSMISYFEELIMNGPIEAVRGYCAYAVIDTEDLAALKQMERIMTTIENNPKIKKMVMEKWVEE